MRGTAKRFGRPLSATDPKASTARPAGLLLLKARSFKALALARRIVRKSASSAHTMPQPERKHGGFTLSHAMVSRAAILGIIFLISSVREPNRGSLAVTIPY